YNSSYLVEKDIRVYEDYQGMRREIEPQKIDWPKVGTDGSPYLFRSHFGSQNPLGDIKFVLRNNRSVYLHGTPNNRLFRQERRALSHGCIRVEQPVALAEYLMKGTPTPWSQSGLRSAIAEKLEASLPLSTPVPVYIWYRTAWVDENSQ